VAEVKAKKWSVNFSQPGIESRSHCPHFGTFGKMGQGNWGRNSRRWTVLLIWEATFFRIWHI